MNLKQTNLGLVFVKTIQFNLRRFFFEVLCIQTSDVYITDKRAISLSHVSCLFIILLAVVDCILYMSIKTVYQFDYKNRSSEIGNYAEVRVQSAIRRQVITDSNYFAIILDSAVMQY